jgi:hypothetical protein
VIGDRAFRTATRAWWPAGQEPDARPAAGRHGQLRQALSRARLCRADSHTDMPVDRRSLKAILADDAAPYGWLSSTLTA